MTATTFRKKPVEVQAVRFNGANHAEILAFAPGKFEAVDELDRRDDPDIVAQVWDELHSTWVGVKQGDWIIQGVAGEFYPCDAEVFAATYEAVPE